MPIAVRFDPQTIQDVKLAATRSKRSFASAIRLLVQFAIEAQARRVSLVPTEPTIASIKECVRHMSIAELQDLRRDIDGEIATRSRATHDDIIRRISGSGHKRCQSGMASTT
jgi:hypothetical protein